MKCEDCGFEHKEGEICPQCGYDAKQDLVALVEVENPQFENKLEKEFSELCAKLQGDQANAQAKISAAWQAIFAKSKQGNQEARHMTAHVALAKKQYIPAHKILAELADANYAPAQVDLANLYETGLGADKNPFDAIKLYRLAAAKGNPIALFKLAEQHRPNGMLALNPELVNAIMSKLASRYPTLFKRREPQAGQGCSCGGAKGPSAQEFAAQSASDMGKMVKYLLIFGIIAFVIYVVWTEFLKG